MADATVVSLTVPGALGYLGVVRMAGAILADAAGFDEGCIEGVRDAITGLWRLFGDGRDRTVRVRFEQADGALALHLVECSNANGAHDGERSRVGSAPVEIQVRWGGRPRAAAPLPAPSPVSGL